ncbi:hypothetical protein WMY93_033652 [Mugilogobius chulae]|uniref:HAUS augmin-like complex subunit 2 n=1 Tax=Mugilogobius chulae TaxID=88201 RepID=A0AAW0MHK0_9GOBI
MEPISDPDASEGAQSVLCVSCSQRPVQVLSRGALGQDEIDSALSDVSPAFSCHLTRAEERIRAQRELDQLQLQMDLLQLDKLKLRRDSPVSPRFVVDLVRSLFDFLETLEQKISFVRSSPTAPERLTEMSSALSQMLSLVAEVQTLSNQILTWKEVRSSVLMTAPTSAAASDPDP